MKALLRKDNTFFQPRKIEAIKAVRRATGGGLKESKEAVEAAEFGGVALNIDGLDLVDLENGLQNTGWYISHVVEDDSDTIPTAMQSLLLSLIEMRRFTSARNMLRVIEDFQSGF